MGGEQHKQRPGGKIQHCEYVYSTGIWGGDTFPQKWLLPTSWFPEHLRSEQDRVTCKENGKKKDQSALKKKFIVGWGTSWSKEQDAECHLCLLAFDYKVILSDPSISNNNCHNHNSS